MVFCAQRVVICVANVESEKSFSRGPNFAGISDLFFGGRAGRTRAFLGDCPKTEGRPRIFTDETDLRTGKSDSKDEIQGSFTAFRMTT